MVYGDLELTGKTGWLTVRMGKGKKTRRVPINEKASEVLKEFLGGQQELAGTFLPPIPFPPEEADDNLCRLGTGREVRRRSQGSKCHPAQFQAHGGHAPGA